MITVKVAMDDWPGRIEGQCCILPVRIGAGGRHAVLKFGGPLLSRHSISCSSGGCQVRRVGTKEMLARGENPCSWGSMSCRMWSICLHHLHAWNGRRIFTRC
jgi:hypothetical protein